MAYIIVNSKNVNIANIQFLKKEIFFENKSSLKKINFYSKNLIFGQ